jgi:GT2 family glycosyltransferase
LVTIATLDTFGVESALAAAARLPRASIVIVNYNGAAFIEPSIRSALEQRAKCEVIVVDNASTDDSLAILREIPGIRLIENDRNAGFGGGANVGASQARGEFVAFLNSDALAEPDWIETLVRWMNAESIDLASSVVSTFDSIWFAGGRWLPALCASLLADRTQRSCDWLSGCALVARRSTWEQLRGFDEGFFMYFEDVDVSLRARAGGFRIGVHPRPLVRHDVPGRSAAALGFNKLKIAYRSKGRLARKHVPRIVLPLALAFQCLVSPLTQGVPPYRLPSIWKALFEGLRTKL